MSEKMVEKRGEKGRVEGVCGGWGGSDMSSKPFCTTLTLKTIEMFHTPEMWENPKPKWQIITNEPNTIKNEKHNTEEGGKQKN